MKKESAITPLQNKKEEIDLLHILTLLAAKKYFIIITALLFAGCALLYSVAKTPVYRSTVLLQLEKTPQSTLITNLALGFGEDRNATATEIGIITSRKVLGKVSDELDLQTEVTPKRVPLLSSLQKLFSDDKEPQISVTKFAVVPELENEIFALTITGAQSFTLSGSGTQTLTGRVNHPVTADGIALTVSKINAPIGSRFNLVRRSKQLTIAMLQKNLQVTESSKSSELLRLSYIGPDRAKITRILEVITQSYMQENLQHKAEETTKSLAFVDSLLPGVLNRLKQADEKLQRFKEENGSVDLSLEAKEILESSVSLWSQKNELDLARAELARRYTKDHPMYRMVQDKATIMRQELDKLGKRINRMPKQQQAYLSMKRDAESEHEIYMQLLAKQNELRIVQASTVGSIRLIDKAESDIEPLGVKKSLVILLGLMLGVIVSSLWCLVEAALRKPLESPEQIEQAGIEVLAIIPESKWLTRHNKIVRLPQKEKFTAVWLAQAHADCMAIEALRSLRTGLFITLSRLERNSILISSATDEVGKTFVSLNLASLIASSGKSVLLIDADLRRGHINELIGSRQNSGLSEMLSGKSERDDIVQSTSLQGLDFIARGESTQLSSELLSGERLAALIEWAEQRYDYVVVDTPPLLAITDAAIVAQHTGMSLLVMRYKLSTVNEVSNTLNRFYKSGIQPDGVIFNCVGKGNSASYQYIDYSIAQ